MALGINWFARDFRAPVVWRLAAHALVALLCGAAGLLVVWAMIDRTHAFSLTAAGIIVNGRLTPWQNTRQFAAQGQPDGHLVRLLFVADGPLGVVHSLPLGRFLSPEEYDHLIATLRVELAGLYPRLDLGGYFTNSA
jgi:hypothetical protein